MINTAIIFDHRNRIDKNGTAPIEVRIIVDRKALYVNTGIKVKKCHFVGGTIVGRSDSKELNDRLTIIYNKIQDEVNKCLAAGEPLDVQEIRRRAWQASEATNKNSTSLIDFIEEQERLMQLREGTLKHYRTLRTRLLEFGLKSFADLSTENICKFDAWLHGLKKPLSDAEKKAGEKPQDISDAGVYNYHKCLKAVLNRAVLFKKIDNNPYFYLRGKFKRGDRDNIEFLTIEEMDAIESLQPVKGTMMAVTRDLFVFQMHTGLSFADLQAFNFSDYKFIDGKWRTIGHRVKTGIQYIVQLTDECLRILEQYNYELPKINNADYNHCLKALGMAAGVKTVLHSHLARHSFATRAKVLGVDIANISKMLGHSNVIQTQRYAKILPEQVFADLSRIENFTNSKNKKL